MAANRDFADYCCELLGSVGACDARRMFGGWGLRIDGLTIAIIADLGAGDKLWLKADDTTRAVFEAAHCERFSYTTTKAGAPVARGMNYYSAPDDAMESAHAMAHWARLAHGSALQAQSLGAKKASPAKRATKRRPQG